MVRIKLEMMVAYRWRDWQGPHAACRRMAGTGRGPKRRVLAEPHAEVLTAAEWPAHLEQPGPVGGCRAQVEGYWKGDRPAAVCKGTPTSPRHVEPESQRLKTPKKHILRMQ